MSTIITFLKKTHALLVAAGMLILTLFAMIIPSVVRAETFPHQLQVSPQSVSLLTSQTIN